ncbi:MAG TPA: immunoglobulin domain-containing protein [Bacteroidales bacterium]|nr:immunoglobulin domain-containing protein [Bacteroidales bacterium]
MILSIFQFFSGHRRSCINQLLIILLLLVSQQSVYSQGGTLIFSLNQFKIIGEGGTITYCVTDDADLIYNLNPGNKQFTGPGIIDTDPNDGRATFDPGIAGYGTHIIRYNGKSYNFIVANPGTVTLAPFPEYCASVDAFTLTGGSPADITGKYYVDGIETATFSPKLKGPGVFSVVYAVGSAGCLTSSAAELIKVKALPAITFLQPPTPLCKDASPVDLLPLVSPAGGVFTGTGVTGNKFDPSIVPLPGTYTITYSYTDPVTGCSNSAQKNITVNPVPVLSITGLDVTNCEYDPDFTFTYSPVSGAGGSAVLTGNGITNLGGGNASFSPSDAGLGYHTVAFSYTTSTGCYASQSVSVRVGTDIKMAGLATNYCQNDPVVNFNYSHWDPDPATPPALPHTLSINGGTGLTDPGFGDASFNPSLTPGAYTITYTYTDDLTCVNEIEKNVQIFPVPVANFAGLSASYCQSASDVTLTGMPPNGTFTGPGASVVNLGGGVATFKPSTLASGSTYNITYSVSNTSGCSDTETKPVTINPLPSAYTVTGSGSYCQGAPGLNVTLFDSDADVNYQLYKNNSPEGGPVAGTGAPIVWNNKTAGTYTVEAKDAITNCTIMMNGSAVILVTPKVTITSQPVATSTCESSTASFNIEATGENLHYQWYKNGIATGTDNKVLILNLVPLTDDGQLVYCDVTSTCGGTITSNSVALGVQPKTSITLHPVDAIRCSGGGVAFTVTATGVNNSYRWKFGAGYLADAAGKISGSSTSSLIVSNLTAADAGLYSCEVTGNCGIAVTSAQAALIVNDPIAITNQPLPVTACAGTNTSFSVTATPALGLTYQWFFDADGGAVAYVPVGADNPSLPLTGVAAANKGSYYCRISNACGEVRNTTTVTLNVPVTTLITGNPVGDIVCAGSNLNMSVTAQGENLTYQWFRDADPVPLSDNAIVHNSTTANISFSGLTALYTGNYRVKVSGTCGDQTSAPDAIISVRQPITITSQPVSKNVCSGNDVTFSVEAGGDDLSFQWQFNTVNIGGATFADYTISGASALNAGNYRCIISSDECGTRISSSATLVVTPVTAITTQPVSLKNACVGTNVSFSVTASGSGLTYQWYKDGAGMGAGFTSSSLNLINVSSASAGSYTCYVTGSCGTVQVSDPGRLTIDSPVAVSIHPAGSQVCLNSSYELNVVLSSGTNPVYKWYFDNDLDGTFIPVAGATGPILTVSPFSAAKAGDYYCSITNGCGSVNSQTARLSLIDVFNITTPLSDFIVCENGNTTLKVATDQPVSYRWSKNGTVIAGQTSSSLILNNIQFADNGAVYSCEIINSCITRITSATVTVTRPLSITLQPQSGIACPGAPYSIILSATGTNPAYQWYKAPGTAIAGATGASLSFSPFAAGDAGTYYCIITNGCGSVQTANAAISAGTSTTVSDPLPLSLCTGDDAVFSVTGSGNNLHYEWRKNYVPLTDDGRIIGSGTNSLTIKDVVQGDEQTYDVVVTGTCGLTATSAGAFLEVTSPPVITANPVPVTICSGGNTSFSVTVASVVTDPLPAYQWQLDGAAIDPVANPSAATPTLDVTGAVTGGIYNCVISNSCGFVTSTSAELIIEQNVNIVSHPALTQTRCEGSNVTFIASITGPTDMTLQWYKDNGTPAGQTLVNGGNISGVNLPTLSINNITLADAGSYFCRATSSCGIRTTNSGILAVQGRIAITQQPQNITVCPGGTLTLGTIATGTVTNYQWKYFDGTVTTNIGANNPVYSVSPFVPASHAGSYTCELTNICETIITSSAVVTAGIPTNAAISANVIECEGGNASFTVTATGSNLIYKWYHGTTALSDNARIGGSESATLTITGLIPGDDGAYQCEVSGSCGFDNDNVATLTVNRNVKIDVQPVSTSALAGTDATFTVVAGGGVTGYQWYKGAIPLADVAGVISGVTTATLQIIDAQVIPDQGTYNCVISGACGNKTTNSANLNVVPVSVITVQPVTPVAKCEGSTLSLSVTASGAGHTYQWKRNSTVLLNDARTSGATTASLSVSATVSADAGAYTCIIDGLEISSASIVTINPPTIISVHPTGGTKCSGDVHIFSVTATGAGLSYQWYKNDLASPVAGATTDEYTINPVGAGDNGTYFCVVTGLCGNMTSSPATLIVNDPVTIVSNPAALTTLCEGTSTSLVFEVTGTGLTYLWKKNGNAITDPNISGTDSKTLVISNSTVSNNGMYSCTVTGLCSSPLTSANATVTVNPLTTILTQPAGRMTCEGDAVTFVVTAGGTSLSYDWQKDGVSLGLPSVTSLTISGLLKATHEGIYTCVVTGTCGTPVTSVPAVLTVNRNTSIGIPVISANPICENSSTRISIAATGDGLTYLWKKNGQPITASNIIGITSDELVIFNAIVSDGGIYTCTVTGQCGIQLTSANAVLTVYPATAIVSQPSGYTKCADDEVIFTVSATGDISSYQWFSGVVPLIDGVKPSGAVVTGSSTSQLKITNITSTEAGSYSCFIDAGCGDLSTTPAVLLINEPAVISAEPPALTQICQGASASITVTTSGTITAYRWKKDGAYIVNGGSFSGVSTNKLVISNATLADAGFYSCEIVSSCNSLNTQSAELRINPLTGITMQPSNATLCEGENVQFMVTATGALPLSYEWRLNNVAILGATTNTLIINSIDSFDAGAYTCFVSGAAGCGTAISNPANLTVNQGAHIVTQPVNTTVCQGSTAIISVAAVGTAPVQYRWKYNDAYISDGGRISGATTNELRISGSSDSDEGIYKCEIVSPCGTAETSSVTLTVDQLTSITIQPSNQNILLGTTAVFSVAANGVITGYQWRQNGSPLTDDGIKITGANTAVLRIANVIAGDAGSYTCIVSGTCGTITSNPGILTVNSPVSIIVPPDDITGCTGSSASFIVDAAGSVVSYQWMFNGANITDGLGITGATTSNLVIASITAANEGDYTCKVTGTFNSAVSSIAQLIVNEPVDISVHPVSKNLCLHDWLILEITATGENLNYEWQKNGIPLAPDANTTGITSSLLVITDVSALRSGSYRCRVSNSCNEEISNVAIINIDPALVLTAGPSGDTKCEGQSTSMSVTATGANISYQWYKGGNILLNSARISGAGTRNLTINNLQTGDQDSYSCLITDNCTSINSANAVLTVKAKVVIAQQPQNIAVCEGQNTFFEVRATGYNLSYQWQKDGVNISDGGSFSGTGTSVLVISNAAYADMGVYRCLVTGDCNSILTNTANLQVNQLPVAAGTVTGSTLICQGSRNVLYVVPAIANATSYVWTLPHGAVIASGAGTRSVEVNFPVGSESGIVSVHGVNACDEGAESPALSITVNPLPLAAAGPDQVLCGDNTTFAADATGYVPASGLWTKLSGQGNITNIALPNSAVTGISKGDNTFMWSVTVGGCTSRDTVKITNKKVVVNAGVDQTLCSMSAALSANTPSSGTGSWSILGGGGLFSNIADPKSNVINLSRGVNTFRWSVNNGGCVSTDDVSVRNDLPTNADAGVDAILVVDNYTLAGNIPSVGTGQWTLISGSGTITNPSLNNTTVTGLGIGDNIFRWTITNGLCYSQDEVKVTNYTPTSTDAGPNQVLCSDRTALTGTKPNYGTGQWSVVAGSGTFTDPYKWDTEVFNIGKGVNIYKWTINEYVVTSDEVTITNNSPFTANAGIDQKLCMTTATLAGNNPLIGTGAWSVIGGSGSIDNTSLYNSIVQNLGSGSNTFRWTVTNGGCSSFDEVNIINEQPTSAYAGSDQVICMDSVSLYPNTPTVGKGEWSVLSGSATFKDNKAYNLARGDNRFAWTITNNTCSHTDVVVITSNKPTTAYTGADKSVCVNNITLPGNTPTYGTGVWTILSGAGTVQNVNNATSQVTDLAPGSNRFRWTITYNGCVSFDEVAVSYDFIAANAGTDQVLCLPSAILNATDAGIGNGQWSVVGGSGSANFVNANQSNTEVNGLDRGMNMLRWTVTNAGCISSDDVVITNNSPSNSYAGSDRSVCGEEIYLNANSPLIGTGEWSILGGSAVISNTNVNNSKVSDLSIGRNVLRWTITNLGCVSYDEVVINNDQPVNIEAGASQYICADSTQLYATAPVVGYGRWSIIKGSANIQDNTLYNTPVTNLGKGENVLIWTVTSAGCSNFDSVLIVNNLPSAPNAGPDLDICSDNVLMSANLPTIGTGKWSVVSGSSTFADPAVPNAKATLLGNGVNVLRWTISNGSCIIFDEVNVLNSMPTIAYAGEDRSICNTTANLLATNPSIGEGSWTIVSGSGVIGDTAAYNSQMTDLGFGQNTLRWTTVNGRCKTSDDVIITNNLAEVYAGPDQVVYQPNVRLIGNKPLKGTGEWIVLAGQGVINAPTGFETAVSGLGGGANTFAWTINNEGCIASDEVVVTHKVMPAADFSPLPGGGCPPLNVTFINTSSGGSPYSWDFGDGTTSASTNTTHTYNVPGNYKVRLTATGPDGLIVNKDTVIIVRPVPVAQFEVTPDTTYIPGNPVHFYNMSLDIDSLLWEFGDGHTSTEENPSYTYSEEGNYNVTLHVWSGYQCYDSVVKESAVFVDLAGVINCPNAFTPNSSGPSGGIYNDNDHSNDVFHCFVDGVVEYHMEVYNRLGIRLFETDDINIGWDGYFKGKLVEEGAYVFKAYGKFNNGQPFSYFGNILVIY